MHSSYIYRLDTLSTKVIRVKMGYREELYKVYVSKHLIPMSGKLSRVNIEDIRKQYPVWNKYYRRHIPNKANCKILELGCGNGLFLRYLIESGYNECYGIDISKEQIDIACSLGLTNVEQSDIFDFLESMESAYDLIVARDVIEHFRKDEIFAMLKLISKALKDRGRLILQTPNGESPFGSRYRYWDFTHEIAFTRSSLRQILLSTGFNRINFYETSPVIKGIKSLFRTIAWYTIRKGIQLYLLVETGSSEGIFTQNIIAVADKD
jgi:SAM-dependent methyltransferase